ncbi:MAG: 2-isopropylmalate synthase, partial [Spirochaetales bacterium]|nr:2-isopropylmalate synthase [Spirochaetales bacterium]
PEEGRTVCDAYVNYNGTAAEITGEGNGPISAVVHALEGRGWKDFDLVDFHEHAIGRGADTEAVAYVQIKPHNGETIWGAGIHASNDTAGINALISAYNRAHA